MSNSQGRPLYLDGLDRLRERLDIMAMKCEGWQFQMSSADMRYGDGALQIEGYNKDLKKHAGMVILDEHVSNGQWEAMLDRMELALMRVDDEAYIH